MKKIILLLLIGLCFSEWNGNRFASKYLHKNKYSLKKKILGAERIKKNRASKEINLKLQKPNFLDNKSKAEKQVKDKKLYLPNSLTVSIFI